LILDIHVVSIKKNIEMNTEKRNKFKIKTLRSVGNPDFQQYAPVSNRQKNITAPTLKRLKAIVEEYITFWDLGGGNFIMPSVFKDNKLIGHFSYNRRFWRAKYHNNPCKQ
jgi:hypothetical protein